MLAFQYVNPEIAALNSGFPAETVRWGNALKTLDTLDIVSKWFKTLNKDDLLSGTEYEKYKFSIYEKILNVPKYSYIVSPGFKNIVWAFDGGIGPVFARDPVFMQETYLYRLLNIESYIFYMNEKQPDNLFMRLNVVDEKGAMRKSTKELPNEYKIHLCVKEEYVLYAFFKVALVLYPLFVKVNPDKYLEMKWNMQARAAKLLPDDDSMRKKNGGPGASIVIYTRTAEPDVMRDFLLAIIQAFPEEASIGNQDLSVGHTIPFGNVRLNHMLCYAQGDRNAKLLAKQANANGRSKKYIPHWLYELLSDAALLKLYFGVSKKAGQPLNDTFIEDVSYLAVDTTMLDPRTVVKSAGRRKTRRGKYKYYVSKTRSAMLT